MTCVDELCFRLKELQADPSRSADEQRGVDFPVQHCRVHRSRQVRDLASLDWSAFANELHVYRAALPHLKRGDCIINTTSVTAYKGSAGMLDYVSLALVHSSLRATLADDREPSTPRAVRNQGCHHDVH